MISIEFYWSRFRSDLHYTNLHVLPKFTINPYKILNTSVGNLQFTNAPLVDIFESICDTNTKKNQVEELRL